VVNLLQLGRAQETALDDALLVRILGRSARGMPASSVCISWFWSFGSLMRVSMFCFSWLSGSSGRSTRRAASPSLMSLCNWSFSATALSLASTSSFHFLWIWLEMGAVPG
jgi:hypothetical protein